MSIELALADAANNCVREGALVTITLKSGVQYTGKLERVTGSDFGTRHMKIDKPAYPGDGGGWVTMLTGEIAAVESHR